MKRAHKILKRLLMGLACVAVAIQFFGPARSNPFVRESQTLSAHLQVNPEVSALLDRSCNDCHSNNTRWPWYSRVAPVSWFVIDHVNHGRSHLNFSEWERLDRREASEMLRAICKEVESGAMPLSSYTPMHPGSELTAADVKVLCEWTRGERARLAAAS